MWDVAAFTPASLSLSKPVETQTQPIYNLLIIFTTDVCLHIKATQNWILNLFEYDSAFGDVSGFLPSAMCFKQTTFIQLKMYLHDSP